MRPRPTTNDPERVHVRSRRRVVFGLTLALAAAAGAAVTGALWVATSLAEHEVRHEALAETTALARGVVTPLLDTEVRSGDPVATAGLERVLASRIEAGGMDHVVVWSAGGRVMFSDRREDVGRSMPLPEPARRALRVGDVVGVLEASESSSPLTAEESQDRIEVWVGANDADGLPYVLQTAVPTADVAAARSGLLPRLVTLALAPVLLLGLAGVVLGRHQLRCLESARRVQSRALGHAIGSWRHQRRRLAQELHDGVVQDLAVVSYGLSVLAWERPGEDTAATVLTHSHQAVTRAEAALREIVQELTPRPLTAGGLHAELTEVAQRFGERGLAVEVEVPADLQAPEGTALLAYRAVEEGLRNVLRHAAATRARVVLAARPGGGVLLEVHDDGSRPVAPGEERRGQGLTLLADTVEDAGGRLRLEPGAAAGSVLRVELPPLQAEPGRP